MLAPHVMSALVERANGNPLFLRELVAAARGGADLDELPETVEALMTARIDTLMPADRRLLRRAAVLGQRFPMHWLRGMLELGEVELTAALARLGDFLDVEPDSVRFGHALQREAAYQALPYERRRALHARAGELIERELGDTPTTPPTSSRCTSCARATTCAHGATGAPRPSRRATASPTPTPLRCTGALWRPGPCWGSRPASSPMSGRRSATRTHGRVSRPPRTTR